MPEPFKPRGDPAKGKDGASQIVINIGPEKYRRVRVLAAEAGISIKEFARQAMDYAIENMGDGDAKTPEA